MPFHTVVYNIPAAGVNAVNSDMTAANDTILSQRNGHYIFTENYRLLASYLGGASVIRGRIQCPTWNAIGEYTQFNANRSLNPPSNPQWDWNVASPPKIPLNEEFQFQTSNNLGAATEIENAVLQLVPDNWTKNLPQNGRLTIPIRASFTVTPTLNAWSGGQQLTFSQSLRGGVYSVIGGALQGSNAVAWRVIFPRMIPYFGRQLRPGNLCQASVGDVSPLQLDPYMTAYGEWGRFHTFEPPTVEVFGTNAASTTYQLFLWLIYLGESLNFLDPSLQGSI